MKREGTQLILDIKLFLDKVDEFCSDRSNIKDIKKRSYKYAEECEKVLKMATDDVHNKSQE